MGWRIENGPEVGRWTADQLGRGYYAERSSAIGLQRDGKIVAGVIYENWNGTSIVVHIVVSGRLNPAYVAAIHHYPYEVCGVKKIICSISDDNERSVRLALNLGFVQEGRISGAHAHGDFLILTQTRDQCRFLDDRYVKKLSLPAPGP